MFPQYFNKSNQKTEYHINEYDVHTLYIRPFLGVNDTVGADADRIPPMMKYTFIGETFYAEQFTEENPWWHKQFPYVSFQSAPKPFSQYGVSEVAKNMGTQIALNIMRNTTLASAMRNSNLPWLVEENVLKSGRMKLGPGELTEVIKGTIDRLMQAPPSDMRSSHSMWQELGQNLRENQGDAQGLLQGGQPSNIRSGAHASVVLNAVLSKSGLRVLMHDPSWQRLARLEMNNLQQYIDFDIGYYLQTREFSEVEGLVPALRNLRYDVSIESKDSLPNDPVEMLNLMLVLYNNGLLDSREFYEHVAIPLTPEFKERIDTFSDAERFIPGLPPQDQAALYVQGQQEVNQIEESI